MATQYKDPIIAKLIALFNASGPALLKNRYYYGDPVLVTKSQLPAVFISKDKTSVANTTNVEDESSIPLVVNVVLDLTRDFNQAFDSIDSSLTLYELIEARNADYTLRSDSLAYILRANVDLGAKLWISLRDGLELDYGIGVEKRGQGVFTMEGVIRLTVTHHQLRP